MTPAPQAKRLSKERLAEILAAHAKEDVDERFREGSALIHHRHRLELLRHIAYREAEAAALEEQVRERAAKALEMADSLHRQFKLEHNAAYWSLREALAALTTGENDGNWPTLPRPNPLPVHESTLGTSVTTRGRFARRHVQQSSKRQRSPPRRPAMAERLTEEEIAAIRARDSRNKILRAGLDGRDPAAGGPSDVSLLLADRAALVKRVEELEGALRPFAAFGRQFSDSITKFYIIGSITNDHVRAAAKALAGEAEKP